MVLKRTRFSGQVVAQAVSTVVLLTLLCVIYLSGPQRVGESPDALAEQASAFVESDEGAYETPWQGELDELQTQPAYRGLQRAVVELNAAQLALLTTSAAADAQATRDASAEYAQALDQVRLAVAMLKSYTDPTEFRQCLQELFTPEIRAEVAGVAIPERKLGIPRQVSVLPEENWL